jgi:hypothetical protein
MRSIGSFHDREEMRVNNHVHHHYFAGAAFGRRRAILGSAAALAGAALAGPGLAEAKDHADDSRPQPAPKPIQAVFPGTDFHVLGPGPESIVLPFSQSPLMGLHVDPSVITDFSGFTALAYPVGTARGSDGKTYNLEGDMRLFSGTYVPASGGKRHGTFGLV